MPEEKIIIQVRFEFTEDQIEDLIGEIGDFTSVTMTQEQAIAFISRHSKVAILALEHPFQDTYVSHFFADVFECPLEEVDKIWERNTNEGDAFWQDFHKRAEAQGYDVDF